MFDYISTQIANYHGWILQQYNVESFRGRLEELFVSDFAAQAPHITTIYSTSAEREIYRLKIGGEEEVYVKRYHVDNRKQRIQTLLRVHKAQKSWRIGKILLKKDIHTPLPIAYFVRRTEHVLVTQGIKGVSLTDYVHCYVRANSEFIDQQISFTEKRTLIRDVAEFLGKLHLKGIYHGDFTAKNILIEENSEGKQFRVYLIDLDSVHSIHRISDWRRIKNLDELGRNFLDLRVFSTADRGRFLQSYLKTNLRETRTFKQLFSCVLQRTRKRLQKYGKQFAPLEKHDPFGSRSDWNLYVFPQWKDLFHNTEEVFDVLANPTEVLHENSRGVVSLIEHHNITFIVKRSKIQEHKRWAQFTSLYRKGEGTRTLRNMAALYSAGLPVPEPGLILEKKKYGFVLASWSLYKYLEGSPCSCAHAHLVAKTLQEIHQKGWVHRDPHVKNFLLEKDRIRIIDCSRARPWRSRYVQMYDVVLLNNCCPGSLKHYGISESNRMYRLAKFQNNLIELWRRIKRKIMPQKYRNRRQV